MRDRSFGWASAAALVAVLLSIAAATAGCGKLRAATRPDQPGLETPPPPPRVIVTAQPEPPPPQPEQTTEEESPPVRPPVAARPAPPKTDGKPPVAAPARVEREPEPEPARAEEARPARALQTGESGAISERGVRDQLARATARLQRVNYRSLSANLKEQYDVAKRFIQQSEEALKAGNLMYASTLAGKASEIAEVLPR